MKYTKTVFKDGERLRSYECDTDYFNSMLVTLIKYEQKGLPYWLYVEERATWTEIDRDEYGCPFERVRTLDYYIIVFELGGHKAVHIYEPQYDGYPPKFCDEDSLDDGFMDYLFEAISGGRK